MEINSSSLSLGVEILNQLDNHKKGTPFFVKNQQLYRFGRVSLLCYKALTMFSYFKDYFKDNQNSLSNNLRSLRVEIQKKSDDNLTLLFNRAIKKYNRLSESEDSIPYIFTETFELLYDQAISSPQVSLSPSLIRKALTSDEIESLEDYHIPLLKEFQSRGGSIFFVPNPLEENPAKIPLAKDDFVYPVCHAGIVRSQVTNLVMKAFKWKLGAPLRQEKVRGAHGVMNGYKSYWTDEFWKEDTYKWCFENAFGIPRSKRFGYKYANLLENRGNFFSKGFRSLPYQNAHDYFEKTYFQIAAPQYRQVFITYANTYYEILDGLLKNPEKSLQGVSLVLIPMEDWIMDNSFDSSLWNALIPKMRLFTDVDLGNPLKEKGLELHRKAYFRAIDKAIHAEEKAPDYEILAAYCHYEHHKRAKPYDQIFQNLRFTLAFSVIADLFQPLES